MFKVLMLRHSTGFEHSYLPDAEVAIKEIGKESAVYEARTTHRCENLTPEAMAACNVLVFATTGDIPFTDEQRAALLDFIRGGGGFMGIHNATDTFHKWPEYLDMINGEFIGHPWCQKITVKVEDASHPAVAHLGKGFQLNEEVYTFGHYDRAKTNVFMSLDNSSVDLAKGNRDDNDYALGWSHAYGEGRVVYSALGHMDETWKLPWFRRHILGCLMWAAGEA